MTLRGKTAYIIGLAVSIIPPAIAALSYFPLWKERGGGAMLSGVAVFLLLISAVPLIKTVKRILKSPASYTVWLILFILFALVSAIAAEMKVISFVGFISNLIGALIFWYSRRIGSDERDRDV